MAMAVSLSFSALDMAVVAIMGAHETVKIHTRRKGGNRIVCPPGKLDISYQKASFMSRIATVYKYKMLG
jgi:hypothetical protein